MAYIPADACWYLADIVLEHTVEDDPRNVVHTNTHLIAASSPDQAYDKAVALGRESEGDDWNTDGKRVRTRFCGLRALNVIYEPLEDGAELIYSKTIDVADEQLRAWIPPRHELSGFAPRQPDRSNSNLMPESIMRALEASGFDREDLLRPESPA